VTENLLFPDAERGAGGAGAGFVPLAERMRPRSLDEVVGQKIVAPGSPLRRALEREHVPSMIFWGPPGSGKTTLARLVARLTGLRFVSFSAVLSGVKEVRAITREARALKERRGTILFVDEIHRFNKGQQDAFLPHVEDGTIVLIGATTENPGFSLNAALLSRCQVFTLDALDEESLVTIGRRALEDEERGLGALGLKISEDGWRLLARTSRGDARSMLSRLETLSEALREEAVETKILDAEAVERLCGERLIHHDRAGDEHYGLISALHKSVRGGDPQAALYWLARLMVGGEDPLFILRRLVRMAVEDIGMGDPTCLPHAVAALDAWRFLGSPEGDLALADCVVHLATAPKSNAVYAAWEAARAEVRESGALPVPPHLLNAPTAFARSEGHGRGYLLPHDHSYALVRQEYLPPELAGRRFYEPRPWGHEQTIRKRLEVWERILREREEET